MASFTTSRAGSALDVQTYYSLAAPPDCPINFNSLDDSSILPTLMQKVRSNRTRNFVLDFSDDEAWVSFDLSAASIDSFFRVDRPKFLNVRWINIWYPSQSKPLLQLLAKRYDFSPRLLALMTSDPRPPRQSEEDTVLKCRTHRRNFWNWQSKRTSEGPVELEKCQDELSEHSSISSYDSVRHGNLYNIINDLWHYSSIDFGRSYVCIGFNSLYGTKHTGSEAGEGLLPHCTRVWTWLILCEDNTVISINEDPFPFSDGRLDLLQERILAGIRRNLVNVFRSLSSVEESSMLERHPMSAFPIRARLGDTPEETAHRLSDAPGLLFYYLFENWHNSYTLVTRRESRYGIELDNLRKEMFKSPKLCHIDRLDNIGTELGILRRHYESYTRLIDRLLEPQAPTTASLENSRVVSDTDQTSLNTIQPFVTEKESTLGVSLSSAARVRFKRLKDLIDLYALSEVEEYIKKKDSLITMASISLLPSSLPPLLTSTEQNFNLIAIKESLDVERLTRVTLFLTKITIIFLPVGLMMTYFSINFGSVQYTLQEFWIGFAVTFLLSCLALTMFGLLTGSVQTAEYWRAVAEWLKMAGRGVLNR